MLDTNVVVLVVLVAVAVAVVVVVLRVRTPEEPPCIIADVLIALEPAPADAPPRPDDEDVAPRVAAAKPRARSIANEQTNERSNDPFRLGAFSSYVSSPPRDSRLSSRVVDANAHARRRYLG